MGTTIAIVALVGVIVMQAFVILHLYREVRKRKTQAFVSPVSGLPNRLGIERSIKSLFARLQRGKVGKITVVAIDLDHFKPINDTYGHKSGDKVLRLVGNILVHSTRPDDIVCHLSGDEFVIVFADTREKQIEEIIARVNMKIARHYFTFADGPVDTRCTYGIAMSASENDTFEHLYHIADLDCNVRKIESGTRSR